MSYLTMHTAHSSISSFVPSIIAIDNTIMSSILGIQLPSRLSGKAPNNASDTQPPLKQLVLESNDWPGSKSVIIRLFRPRRM